MEMQKQLVSSKQFYSSFIFEELLFLNVEKQKILWAKTKKSFIEEDKIFSRLGAKYGVYAMQPETEIFWLFRTDEAPVLLRKLTCVCVNVGHRGKKM